MAECIYFLCIHSCKCIPSLKLNPFQNPKPLLNFTFCLNKTTIQISCGTCSICIPQEGVHIVKNVNALDKRSVTYDVNTTLSNRIASTSIVQQVRTVLRSSSLDLKPVEQRIAYFDDKLPPLFCVKSNELQHELSIQPFTFMYQSGAATYSVRSCSCISRQEIAQIHTYYQYYYFYQQIFPGM